MAESTIVSTGDEELLTSHHLCRWLPRIRLHQTQAHGYNEHIVLHTSMLIHIGMVYLALEADHRTLERIVNRELKTKLA